MQQEQICQNCAVKNHYAEGTAFSWKIRKLQLNFSLRQTILRIPKQSESSQSMVIITMIMFLFDQIMLAQEASCITVCCSVPSAGGMI